MTFPVNINTRLEPREAFHFFFYSTIFRNTIFVPFLLIVSLSLSVYTAYSSGITDPVVYIFLWVIFLPILSIGILFNVWRMSSKAKRKTSEPLFYQPLNIKLYNERMRINYPGKQPYNLPLNRITRTIETKKYLVFYVNKSILFIRKEDLPGPKEYEFLKKKLKPKKVYIG